MTKRAIAVVLLAMVCGCSRRDYVDLHGVRDGDVVLHEDRVPVAKLQEHLEPFEFSTATRVRFTSSSQMPVFTEDGDVLIVRYPKDWSHAQISTLMDELVEARVGQWPDSFTGKIEGTQQPAEELSPAAARHTKP